MRNTAIVAITVLVAASSTVAQDYDIAWHTIDAGGGTFSTGGNFELGGNYELAGGFWPGVGEFCFGDLNGDLNVNLADLAELLSNYGTTSGMTYEDGDLDGDGDVDLSDLAALLAVYGTTCP